jgi:8-oxo-dGTP diphosphatase
MSDAAGDRIHQVVAALLIRADGVLLCHRSPDRTWFPDVWDFPGGHVEENERAEDALVREIEEEVGVVIARPTDPPIVTVEEGELRLRIWVVREWSGEPENLQPDEHDEIAWFGLADVRELRLADAHYIDVLEHAFRSDCARN